MAEFSNGVSVAGGVPAQGRPGIVSVALRMRVVPHAPVCPECGSDEIITDPVDLGDGIAEIAYICELCGAAWPLACVCEWSR
jgi:hypothetical protein